jgi:hypothetical protein
MLPVTTMGKTGTVLSLLSEPLSCIGVPSLSTTVVLIVAVVPFDVPLKVIIKVPSRIEQVPSGFMLLWTSVLNNVNVIWIGPGTAMSLPVIDMESLNEKELEHPESLRLCVYRPAHTGTPEQLKDS